MTEVVSVIVNGHSREVEAGTVLADLVASLTSQSRGVAAAVNDAVVPRGEWIALPLREHDRIEVLTAVQGG